METVKGIIANETTSRFSTHDNLKPSVEVIVLEDNHLLNMLMSRAIVSAIKTIQNLKNISVKFSRFHLGREFLYYLEKNDFYNSKLIVFSDYFLEDQINGSQIIKRIKQKKTDATVVIVSDTANDQIPVEVINLGAYQFVPKGNKAPAICSDILYKKII